MKSSLIGFNSAADVIEMHERGARKKINFPFSSRGGILIEYFATANKIITNKFAPSRTVRVFYIVKVVALFSILEFYNRTSRRSGFLDSVILRWEEKD